MENSITQSMSTVGEIQKMTNKAMDAVMLGRGLIANPALTGEINNNQVIDKQVIMVFHDAVYVGYQEVLSGYKNVLFKMKESWFYMIHLFAESDKYIKKIIILCFYHINQYDKIWESLIIIIFYLSLRML